MDRRQHATWIKNNMVSYYLNGRNFMCATSEMALQQGIADVVAIASHGIVYEVEVKVDWADLKSELDHIKEILRPITLFDQHRRIKPGKYDKHWIYLKGAESYLIEQNKRWHGDADAEKITVLDSEYKHWLLPHRFYFAVTPELEDRAREALQGTPYGLYNQTCDLLKTAQSIHNADVPFGFYEHMMHKLSRINHENTLKQGLRDPQVSNIIIQ